MPGANVRASSHMPEDEWKKGKEEWKKGEGSVVGRKRGMGGGGR